MLNKYKLNKIDIKILEELSRNPNSTLTELASNTKISRPTITTHLKDLGDSEILIYKTGLSLRKMDFTTALVALEVKGEQSRSDIEGYLSHCPRVMNLFRTSGKSNLQVFCWGENEHTLASTIEDFRNLPGTEVVSSLFLGHPVSGDFVIDLSKEKSCKSPCGKIISTECQAYLRGDCFGCPGTVDYRGPLKAE